MHKVTRYEAIDGAEFETEAACLKHEALIAECAAIVARLEPRANLPNCNYENGHGYVQQVPATVLSVQADLVKIARRYFTDKSSNAHFDFAETAAQPAGLSMVGRFIDDGCPSPVNRAWRRICCMDAEFREWGQPYFAMNPERAEAVRLNLNH